MASARHRQPTTPDAKNKGGRISSYRIPFAEMAYKHCLNGCTDKELAEVFEVSEQTLNAWKKKHPKFLEAIKKGKRIANAEVASTLYKRATGAFTLPAVKIFQCDGESFEHPYTERFPPDTTAAIFFLKNRDPEHWRDRQQHEVSGPDGGPMQMENLTAEQCLALAAKRGLVKAK